MSSRMIRVQAVLAATGMEAPASFDDEWIFTACPRCGQAQTLGDCTIRPGGCGETHYVCKNGCQTLLIVSPAPGQVSATWPGRGYRFGDYVVRNAADVVMLVGTSRVRLSASADALLPESSRPLPTADLSPEQ